MLIDGHPLLPVSPGPPRRCRLRQHADRRTQLDKAVQLGIPVGADFGSMLIDGHLNEGSNFKLNSFGADFGSMPIDGHVPFVEFATGLWHLFLVG